MNNRILYILAPLERLDLLSLGERVFFDCVGKLSGEYRIQITVDMGVAETSEYYIAGNNRIVKKGILLPGSQVLDAPSGVTLTLDSYYELLVDRIQYLLPAIGLSFRNYNIDDAGLTIAFTINTSIQEEYKNILHDRIWWQFEYKTYEELDTVKRRVLEFIGRQAHLNAADTIVIGKENIDIAFDEVPRPKPIVKPDDDLTICDIYLSDNPLELVLHDMILDGYILSMEEYRGKFRVTINKDTCIRGMPMLRPIRFDKTTGAVYLHDECIGTLPISQKGYNLFSVLYKSPNVPILAETLMRECRFKSNSKSDVAYIDKTIDEAIDTKLGKEFTDKYIQRESNHFKLINQEL